MMKNSKDKTEDKSSKDKTEDKEKSSGGLKIENLEVEVSGSRVRPNQRMWLTADGKTLVPEGHKDAASLYCNGNKAVLLEEFENLKKVGFKD